MKQALMLLPDVALLIVICMAAAARLYSTHTAIFFFLCAWFLFSVSTAVMAQAMDTSAPPYAVIYAIMQWLAIACLAPAVVLAPSWLTSRTTLIAGIFCALAIGIVGEELQIPLSFFVLGGMGAQLLIAAIVLQPGDRVLFGCLGANLVVFSFGVAAARRYGRGPAAYEWVAFAATAIWIVLAWNLGSTPDAIVNPERLALTPTARFLFGFVREALRG